MRKTIGILVFLAFISSCSTLRNNKGSVRTYRREMVGDVGPGPSYLILRGSLYYEEYYPWGDESYFGSFKMSNDTLCLCPPKYGYYHREHSLWEEEYTSETSFSNVPTYYKIKNNKLIDITDYSQYPELEQWIPDLIIPNDYIRVR